MTALIFLSHSRATFRIGCVFVTSVLYGVHQLLQPVPALLIHVPEGYPPRKKLSASITITEQMVHILRNDMPTE